MTKDISEGQLLEEELLERELATRLLSSFTTYTMPEYEMIATQNGKPIHQQIINKLEAVERGEIKRVMIFCPPRLGKSELVSKRFPAWYLGKNPDKSIILASYGADLASDFGRKTKQIVSSQEYKNIFPNFELSKDKREGGNWETSEGGGMYTVGRGGALTGKGGDILIIDDIVKDREEAESDSIQSKTPEWYTSTFRTRKQNQDSAIIVMMTRWNQNDLAGYLLEQQKEGGEQWDTLIIKGIDDKGNEIIWNGRWDKGFMKKERDNMMSKDWSALYQQDPIASSSNIFSLSDLRYFLMSDFEKADGILKKEDLRCILHIDPAFSSSDTSDDVSILLTGKHKLTGNYYQLDGYADTSKPSISFKVALEMYDRGIMEGFKIDYISIESVNINKDQTKFIKDFKEFLKKQDRYIQVNEQKPVGKKVDRIKFTLEPIVSLNGLFFRKDMSDKSFMKRIKNQFYQFPHCKKFDIIDNVEHGVRVLDKKNNNNLNKQPVKFHNKMTGKMVNTGNNNRGNRFGL